jgi:hypothetical protein
MRFWKWGIFPGVVFHGPGVPKWVILRCLEGPDPLESTSRRGSGDTLIL